MTVEPKEGPESQVPAQESSEAGAEASAEGEVLELVAGEDGSPPSALDQLQEELSTTRDRLLRALADLDNQRKRMDRERQQLRTSYLSAPLREFLEVVDNLDRALAAEAAAGDFRAGVEMIRRQMGELLRRFDVEPVESLNAVFDPNLHEAVAREESAEVDEPTVVQELQRGYTMRSTLLRAAMVRVAMPAAQATGEGAPPDGIDAPDGRAAGSDAAGGGA
ncbi:MAG: nucleotide exchange factor GrpE [Acidobacteria bacterium]|nr:nucleotide exchange factor GrpE [Acidobacteriota bacterium]